MKRHQAKSDVDRPSQTKYDNHDKIKDWLHRSPLSSARPLAVTLPSPPIISPLGRKKHATQPATDRGR